ncbi:MAG: DUF4097 domain-containing protein [Gammaproteobacteria bacterium]
MSYLSTARAVALALAFSLPALSASAGDLQRNFDVADGGLLKIDTEHGKIDVRTDGRDVQIEVLRDGSRAEEFIVEFEQDGDDVTVVGEWPDGLNSWRSRPKARIEFRVTVPPNFNLDLDSSGGSLRVADLGGSLRARTSGGSIQMGVIAGEVDANTSGGSIKLDGGGASARVNTSGGSIRVGRVAGDLHAHTSGGSVRIDGVQGNVDATTSGGSVEATLLQQPTSDCKLSTSGGTVTLNMAGEFAVDINASSGGGRVTSDWPIDGKKSAKRRLRGSLNGGGPLMRLSSSGGGVRIRRDR